MTALVDTNIWLAALVEADDLHAIGVIALDEEPEALLPGVVLPELAYMLQRDNHHPALSQFMRDVATNKLPLIETTPTDLGRAAELLEKYADARVDFVDCVIVALAERLNITRILTLDRRHFMLFRPKHCAAFELLP
jgi:predicted nucleic acid-binding protein